MEQRRGHQHSGLRCRTLGWRLASGLVVRGLGHELQRTVEHLDFHEADEAAVADHGTLRSAGRAAREEDGAGVVFVDVDVRELVLAHLSLEAVAFGDHVDLRDGQPARHSGEALLVAEDDPGGGEFGGVANLVGRPPAVVEADHRTHRDEREVGDDPFGGVGGQDCDPIASCDLVVGGQRGRLGRDEIDETLVGDAPIAQNEELGIAVSGRRFDEVSQ